MQEDNKLLKTLAILASIATIVGTCIAIIALLPAFGEWFNVRVALPNTAQESTIRSTSTPLLENPSSTPQITFTPVSTFQPFETGSFDIVPYASRLGYSFEQGVAASPTIPADVMFYCFIDAFGYRCRIVAIKIWPMGRIPLNEIIDVDDKAWGTETYATIEVGESFVVTTYSGHLAKFSVSYIAEDYTFTINWVYQPKDRLDFDVP